MLVELILGACTECDRPHAKCVAMVTFRFFLYDEVNQNAVLADNFSSSQLVTLECIDDSTGVLISKVTVCIYAPYNVSGMVPTPTMFRKSDFVINY